MTSSPPAPSSARPVRVASVPAGHVYVRHLDPWSSPPDVLRLPDPSPPGAAGTQRWWPPVMLDASWIDAHADDFDVFHVHFGFDAVEPGELTAIVAALRRHGKPLVHTVHDLRNPHHADAAAHTAQLDVLVPAADALITLTPGAAGRIARRWGRQAQVLPHPHVVPLDRPPRAVARRERRYTVGVHAKSLRANADPAAVVAALLPLARELPDLRIVVNLHREVLHRTDARSRELLAVLDDATARGAEVTVHDYLDDAGLWAYLESLDLSVLPYRFGTHSGWLEACFDLGTTVLAPDCGHLAQQRPCLTYHHDEQGLDAESLRAAVRTGYRERPTWRARRADREAERDHLSRAHRALYDGLLG